MSKIVVTEISLGKIVMVDWPMLESSKANIKDTVIGILDLLKSQQKNESVTIHQVLVCQKELDGLSFTYNGSEKFLNYNIAILPGRIRILMIVPDVEAVKSYMSKQRKLKKLPKKKAKQT